MRPYFLDARQFVRVRARAASLDTIDMMITRRVVPYAFVFVAAAAFAQLRTAEPAAAGFAPDRLARAADLLDREVANGRVPAASILVARRERIVLRKSFGRMGPASGAPAVDPDSVFLLASITKPVTACAVMLLVDRGLISLDDPVSHYLPEFRGDDRAGVRVRDLLSHTSGLPDMLPENTELRRANAPLSEFVRHTFTTPLLYKPRTSFTYQSMGILLAGEIVERVSGMPLRDFERKEIFQPLGMKDSSLGLGGRRIADTVWCCSPEGGDRADVERFGPNTQYWRDIGHPWGGMHSTTDDLAILLQTMLNGGVYAGKRVFSPAAARAMVTDQNARLGAPWGLGWALAHSPVWSFFGELVSPAAFGHVGATGTVAWADPETGVLCVILTNRNVSEDRGRLLRRVSNAVAAAVEER
ncbi:MAG: beta-lactamase family protein [Bryobacteraceae bacterium]|nr:beta-lactamase family protein [Bryobacteraceae bacterium]